MVAAWPTEQMQGMRCFEEWLRKSAAGSGTVRGAVGAALENAALAGSGS